LEQIKAELLNGRDLSKKGNRKRQVEYVTRTAEKALRGVMFRPRHISPMEIAVVDWIGVKFFERLHPNALSRSVPPARLCHLDGFALFILMSARNSAARE